MTVPTASPSSTSRCRAAIRSPLPRLALAGLLGVAAALLVSCGSSGNGLIPSGNAGPLQNDFQAVAQAAENGNGSCAATETAIRNTEQDFRALPATVDQGLRSRLAQGITNLRKRALEVCVQPLAQATTTSATPRSTTSTQTKTATTTPTVAQTTPTQTTPTTSTPTTSVPGGGVQAPQGEASPGGGNEQGGAGAGEGAGGALGGGSGGAQEGGK
jgi:hypothetical protein